MTAHVDERLSAYLDGELPEPERAAIDLHLAACRRCAAHLAELAAVDAAARQLPVEAPAGYYEALPGRVRFRLEAERRRAARPARRPLGLPAWAWTAAAAAAVAAVSIPLLQVTWLAPTPLPEAPLAAEAGRPALQEAPAVPAATVLPTPPAGARQASAPAPARVEQPPAEADRDEPGRVTAAATEPAAPPPQAAAPGFAAAPPSAAPAGGAPTALPTAAPLDERRQRAPSGPELPGAEEAEAKREAQLARPGAAATGSSPGRPEPAKRAPATGEAAAEAGVAAEAAAEGALAAADTAAGATARQAVAETQSTPDSGAFRALLARPLPRSLAEARARHAEWRRLAASLAGAPADEARVQALETAALVHRLSGAEADRAAALAEARAYLARDDARQRERVERVLAGLLR